MGRMRGVRGRGGKGGGARDVAAPCGHQIGGEELS